MIHDPDLLIRKITAEVHLKNPASTPNYLTIPVYSLSLRLNETTPTALDCHLVLEYYNSVGVLVTLEDTISDFDPVGISILFYQNGELLEGLVSPGGTGSGFVGFDTIAIKEGPSHKTAGIKGSKTVESFPENNIMMSNFNIIVSQTSEYGKYSYQLASLPIVAPSVSDDPAVNFVYPGDSLAVRDTGGVCRKPKTSDTIISTFVVGSVTVTFPPLTVSISESESA
jgi:hypothetical protein